MIAMLIILEGLVGATAAALLCVLQSVNAIDVGWGWAVSPLPLSIAAETSTVIVAWIQMLLSERKGRNR